MSDRILICNKCRASYFESLGHTCSLDCSCSLHEGQRDLRQSNILTLNGYDGVISEGTLRHEDLVARFELVLIDLDEAAFNKLQDDFDIVDAGRDVKMDDPEYLVALTDALNEAAPEGYHFGTIEGDGACFGFWVNDSEEDGTDEG